ncbi:MAG: hypothetical protein AB1442_07080 [Nitrospirota bacterium]
MKIAIIRNWRKYNLPHVMCGFVDESDFQCFSTASVCFGDGSGIEVRASDRDDLIITNIPAMAVPE